MQLIKFYSAAAGVLNVGENKKKNTTACELN